MTYKSCRRFSVKASLSRSALGKFAYRLLSSRATDHTGTCTCDRWRRLRSQHMTSARPHRNLREKIKCLSQQQKVNHRWQKVPKVGRANPVPSNPVPSFPSVPFLFLSPFPVLFAPFPSFQSFPSPLIPTRSFPPLPFPFSPLPSLRKAVSLS